LRQEAEQNELEAERLRSLEESQRKIAEENFRRLQVANQQLTAERRSVEERGKLFLAFPEWLQAYSAEAVAAHARSQIEANQRADALKTYAEFCDLALADDEGFWARELVRIDPEQLQQLDLDTAVLATRIQVKPIDIFKKVIEPGIALGEQEQKTPAGRDSKSLLASLYDSQARLLFQQPALHAAADDHLVRLVQIYDRAIELDDSRAHFYVGRAVARFLNDGTQLEVIEADLRAAMSQYPTRVEPPSAAADITDAHRDLALIQNGLGNIAELQADANRSSATVLLTESLALHTAAAALNPADVRYAISLARVHRKLAMGMTRSKQRPAVESAVKLLLQAVRLDVENARLHNELGEAYMLLDDLEDARGQFDLAVRLGGLHDSAINRYRYYCNQANAYWRTPTNAELLQKSLGAADLAIKLNPENAADAFYYSGLARWSLANLSDDPVGQKSQLDRAITAFETALAQDESHVGAILGRCQLMFERQLPAIDELQSRELLADTDRALQLAVGSSDKAKAYYVRGLGLVRRFVDGKQELPLVEALEAFLASGQASDEYVTLVSGYFDQAARRTWADAKLQTRASVLSVTFGNLAAADR
jgi:tetratricopeptide (TPR) repeat protein